MALALGAGMPPAQADMPATLVPEASRIVFVTRQLGVPVEGGFQRFDARIAFDPRHPEDGSVVLRIDTASATLGVPQSDAELPKPAWFDVASHPQALFRSQRIRALGAGRFEVAGTLTLKGRPQPVVVPVSIEQSGGRSTATGSLAIQRLAFRIGEGEWADTSVVGDEVQVRFKLVLTGLGPL